VVVNTATESELVTIKGIGVTYAKRIIERREKLGGFYTADQLNEVYGMSKETVDKITPYLVFSPDARDLKKLHIFRGKDVDRILPYLDLN